MASSTLLWIHHDDARQTTHELSATVRQHVMVNYHIKKAKEAQEAEAADKPKPASPEIKDAAARVDEVEHITTVDPRAICSSKAKPTIRHVAYLPSPAPGLINDQHRSIYRAIWWHRYAASGSSDELDWTGKCRSDLGKILWDVAKTDKTILELFMCFSAAKEIHVKGSSDTRAYYHYKGRAISLLSQDVHREGTSLNLNAIAAICLLNRIAFSENEYGVADLHVRALHRLAAHRVRELPGPIWLLFVWADLHLTGVHIRAPYLRYHVHPSFRSRPFSGKFQFDADTYFSRTLPDGLVVSSCFKDTATQLYEDLRELGYSFNQSLEWDKSRGISYDIAYRLAEAQKDVDSSGSLEERLIIIGFEMQYWGTSKMFLPQSGIQSFQMDRLSYLISTMQPSSLCTRWLEHTSSFDLLLWCLLNAAGSALHQPQPSTSQDSTPLLPSWLQRHVTYLIELLDIVSPSDLETRMHRMPFTNEWNRPACRSFFSGPRAHGYVATDAKLLCEPDTEPFRDLRQLFDSSYRPSLRSDRRLG